MKSADSPKNTSQMATIEPDATPLSFRLITLAVILGIFGILAGGFSFWDESNFHISPALSYTSIFAIIPLIWGLLLLRRSRSVFNWKDFYFCPQSACFGLFLVFFSDWLTRGFNLFQGPMIRGELIAVFLILIIFFKTLSRSAFLTVAISASFLLFAAFIHQSNANPILSDDHASFIFRLTLLKDNFPNIPFYHPWWNAGLDARDFFATGAIGFFLLTAPLQYLFSITDSYNFSVGFVLFAVLPLSLAYATQLARVRSPGPAIASIIGLATSLVWFRWSLKYGTMGFITSAALMPMVFMLGCRLINNEKLSRVQFSLFILAISISCMWPLGGACYLGLALCSIFQLKTVLRNKQIYIAAILLILINLPWAIMLWKVSKVGNFIQTPRTVAVQGTETTPVTEKQFRHKNSGFDLKKALKVVREQANGTNPLILFLFLPGLTLIAREYRKPLLIQALLLLTGGSILVSYKPQLELDRLLVFLSILLAIPTTACLVSLYENQSKSTLLSCFAFSFLFLTPWIGSNVLSNRSAEVYHFADDLPQALTKALDNNLTTGRAVFSGFVLHELDGGHVAPLAIWSKKPLVASSPFHNKWKYTSVIPGKFLENGDAGINKYLDLMNAEVVLAHEAQWRSYFLNHSNQFKEVWHQKPFMMFKKVGFISNYFLQGDGEISEQTSNAVKFRLKTSEAVLKFIYFPFLTAGSCTLSPYDAGLEFPLIKLTNCPTNTDLSLQSISALQRLLQ